MKGGGRPKTMNLHMGMKGKAPSGTPTGGHRGGGSVNKGSTRSGTAKTPKTPGGREA